MKRQRAYACLLAMLAMAALFACAGCNEVLGIHVLPENDEAGVQPGLNSVFGDGGVDATVVDSGQGGSALLEGGVEAGAGCAAGDLRCNPAAPVIQQCDVQGIWRDTPSACPFACSGAGASTACTGSCIPGTASCGPGGVPLLCDSTGTNQPQAPCPSVCTGNGTCTGDCVPTTTRCTAGSTTLVETCDQTGAWGAPAACTYVCDPTTNQCGGECVPGAPAQCSGSAVQQCSPAGVWTTVLVCATTPCSQGACQACSAGQKQCNAGKPQTCDASGIWVDDQASPCPFLCDGATGLCSGSCVPGTSACGAGQTTTLCGANALPGSGVTCANICDPATGLCGGVCSPTTTRCNGSTAQTCGGDGQWGSDTACPFGCDASTGMCSGCVDDPLSTTCAGGKCGPTPNNCGHTAQCPASCAGTGETCGGGGVAGVCGCSPETQATACGSAVCGSAPNGCSGMVACGTCTPPLSCDATGQCVNTMCPVCAMGTNCGSTPVTPGCAVVSCGTCTAPQTSCSSTTGPGTCVCTPQTQAQACGSNDCGSAPDGCGGSIPCGACTAPQTSCAIADGGTAGSCVCTPKTVVQACGSAVCGMAADGCGAVLSCGTCAAPLTCNATGQCINTMCPVCPMGSNCGTTPVTPGCTVVNCGTCTAPQTSCTPATGPGMCVCTPKTRAQACGSNNCGTASDGCGNTITCGTCAAPNPTCGIPDGSTAGTCGCVPVTEAQACGANNCGSVSNGCTGTIVCGTCPPATPTCSATTGPGVCRCVPLTQMQACGTNNCGSVSDGCTGTIVCGTCPPATPTCSATTGPGVCRCVPLTHLQACGANNCGSISDGCTGTIVCGTCPAATPTCSSTGPGTCGGCQLGTNANCASCGDNCTAQGGKTCQNGACACPAGQALCNGACIATSQCVPARPGNPCDIGCNVAGKCTDTGLPDPAGTVLPLPAGACTPGTPGHCTEFQLSCAAGGVGTCTVDSGVMLTNGTSCVTPGATGEPVCCGGSCVDVDTSTADCGACGVSCGTGAGVTSTCTGGVCQSCTAGAPCVPLAPFNPCDKGSTVCNGSKATCVDTGVPASSGTRCGAGIDVCDGKGVCTCPNEACGSCSDNTQCIAANGTGGVQVLCCGGSCNDVQVPCDTPPTPTDPLGQCSVGVSQCTGGAVTCAATGQLQPDGTRCGQSLEKVCLAGSCVNSQYGPCKVNADCVPGGCLDGICLGTIRNPGVVTCGFPTTCTSAQGCSGGGPFTPAPLVCGNKGTGGYTTCDATSDCAANQDCCGEDAAGVSLTQICYPRRTPGVPGSGCPIVEPNQPVSVSLVCDPLDATNASCPTGSTCTVGGSAGFGCVCPDGSGPARYCRDHDGDGDGDPNFEILQCGSLPPPAGYTTSCLDCCDSDARQFFGSTFCSSLPSNPSNDPGFPESCGTFLYNCQPNPDPNGSPVECDPATHVANQSIGLNCTIQTFQCMPDGRGGCFASCSSTGTDPGCESGSCQTLQTDVCGGTATLISETCDAACDNTPVVSITTQPQGCF